MKRSGLLLLSTLTVTFLAGLLMGAVGGDVLGWRIKLYGRKVLGDLPELRWSELLVMTSPTNDFQLRESVDQGRSLDAAIANPYTHESDIREGEELFQGQCAVCHGDDGSGGHGPSLRRASYSHGDSDFAIYRVMRDGIPQTAMVPAALDASERWQIVSYLRSLQGRVLGGVTGRRAPPLNVTNDDLVVAGTRTDEWLTYSGNLKGWRYSSLAEITPDNASSLRPVWTRSFPSDSSVQSSTPLIVDGTMFVSESPSNAVALDPNTGEFLWRYDHDLPVALPVCCGRVNRGMAVLGDLVYLATLDAQLVALDAHTGEVRWAVPVAAVEDGFTMTVAPLTFDDKVIVGVAGGEYAIRGFVAAYDASTGEERWRFNTIPGPGEPGHETWLNDAWRTGGGPTWVTGSYDAELDLLYWGVGNPAPDYQGNVRPGDNLFTNSVVALRGRTGELVWHFQFTPHDEHDWDSTQTPILADLEFEGQSRRVIAWANRNGFYYLLDRTNGEFLTGVPFVKLNWADGLDERGRPILTEVGESSVGGRRTYPGVGGGTNWYPAAYDPMQQVLFVHANEQGSIFTQTTAPEVGRGAGGFYVGSGAVSSEEPILSVRAIDIATGSTKWIYDEPPPQAAAGFTGLLATAGGLVFGATGGYAFAVDSSNGREVWRLFLGGNTNAPPVSFSLNGRQVVVFWSGRALRLFAL